MPVPSRGCRTCRLRHLKCDETYPICNRCVKAGKDCLGYARPPDQFAFRDENGYASGVQRRPRDSSQRRSESSTESSTRNVMSASKTTKSPPDASKPTQISYRQARKQSPSDHCSILKCPDTPVEEYALENFVHGFVDTRSNVSNSHWGYMKRFRNEWHTVAGNSPLAIATSAVALAVFSRVRASSSALQKSIQKYNEAVKKTLLVLSNRDQVQDDRTLLSVMLLDVYEGITGNGNRLALHENNQWLHQCGAESLLKIRRGQSRVDNSTAMLDRDVRRRLIRACVGRASALPDWLRDGSEFGEEGVELILDRCLVQITILRCNVQTLLKSLSGGAVRRKEAGFVKVENLINQAMAIERDLVAWATSLPPDWSYQVHEVHTRNIMHTPAAPPKNPIYGNFLNIYPNVHKARVWDSYRAARLVTNGIIAGIPPFLSLGYRGPQFSAQQEIADHNVKNLTDEICASVPFYLGKRETDKYGTVTAVEISDEIKVAEDATARDAFLLVFPLCVAAAMSRIPSSQKEWINKQIMILSRLTGSYTLEKVARGC